MVIKEKIILDKKIWEEWCGTWLNSFAYSVGGLLSNVQDIDISDMVGISEDLKEQLIIYKNKNIKRQDVNSNVKHFEDWVRLFENKFNLPDNTSLLWWTNFSMFRKPDNLTKFIRNKFGEEVLFDCLINLTKEKRVDFFVFKEIIKSKYFKFLDEKDKLDLYKQIIKKTEVCYEGDARIIGIKVRLELKKSESEIFSYIKRYREDAVFMGKAERLLGKEISFENEILNIEVHDYLKRIKFQVNHIMRISKLPESKATLLVDGFIDVILKETLKSNGIDYEKKSATSIEIIAKTIDELKLAEDLCQQEMENLKKALPKIKFSNKEERNDMLNSLRSIVLHDELKEDLNINKPNIINKKKI